MRHKPAPSSRRGRVAPMSHERFKGEQAYIISHAAKRGPEQRAEYYQWLGLSQEMADTVERTVKFIQERLEKR